MATPQVVALVPMRHNSERVPGKNYRQFGDAPLFHHVVRSLLEAEQVTEVLIDTDSATIKEQCEHSFPEVRVIDRPDHLTAGEIAMNRIIEHDLAYTDADIVLQTHSTNPLLTAATIDLSVRTYLETDSDSAFTVTRLQQRLWDQDVRPVNHDPAELLRTQDLPPLFIENSCAFVFSRDLILATGSRIGQNPALIEMDPIEAMDIDIEADFVLAETMWQIREETR